MISRLPFSIAWRNEAPAPSHAGNIRRFCIHAKIHGIARKLSTPPVGFRFAGREPSGSLESSCSGVALRKYGTKS